MTTPTPVGGLDQGRPITVTCPYCGKTYQDLTPPTFCLGERRFPPEVLEEARHLTCPHCQRRTYYTGGDEP